MAKVIIANDAPSVVYARSRTINLSLATVEWFIRDTTLDSQTIWKQVSQYGVLALLLSLMTVEWLRGGPLSSNLPDSFQGLRDDAVELALSKTFQSAAVTMLFVYHLLLLWIKAARKGASPGVKAPWWRAFDRRDLCKLAVVLCAVVGYAADWALAPQLGVAPSLISGVDQSTNVLVLLAGIVLSQIVEGVAKENDELRWSFGRISLMALIVFLAAASLARHEAAFNFKYRGESRATGLWLNPNTYGLLMGVGLVLALAYLAQANLNQTNKSPPHDNMRGGGRSLRAVHWDRIALELSLGWGAAVLLTVGLIRSYSRGAWLGAMLGIGYLCFSILRFAERSDLGTLPAWRPRVAVNWLRHHAWLGIAICSSLLIIVMFRAMHSENLLVRRVVSMANANDFSWRNRVVAWEGALQIIADHPLAGVGWHRVSDEFRQFYAPPRLTEDLSIILNDYLTLGMALGIPALACFIALLRMSFLDYGGGAGRWEWVVPASRSALIVLLIGFWFDGGLFKLALAAPCWLFLELAVDRGRDPK